MNMKYDHHVMSQVIGKLRVQQGLSQEAIAKKAQLARSHYAMIESGAKRASAEKLWSITQSLEMRLSKLIRLVEDQK